MNVVGRNLKYLKSLGYNVNVGDNIEIDVNHLKKNSKVKIRVKCDICGKEKELSNYAYNKNLKYNIYCCSIKCSQEKIEQTNKIKYNCKRPIQNKDIRNKLENTNKIKYNNKIASKSDEVKLKIKDKVNKFIEENKEKHNYYVNKSVKKRKENTLEKYKKLNIISLNNGIYQIKCEKNHIYEISTNLLYLRTKYQTEPCTICNDICSGVSGYEIQVRKYIESVYNKDIIFNSKKIIKPYELDIFLPNLNIAFEFNGKYWHDKKDKNYHYNKSKLSCDKNIRLFHIWENDWLKNREFIKKWIHNLIFNIEYINYNSFGMVDEYSTLNSLTIKNYSGKKVKRFFSDILNEKLLKIECPKNIYNNTYNEGYKIYEII